MSTSRCLRTAFEACRPSKSLYFPIQSSTRCRYYATKPQPSDGKDVSSTKTGARPNVAASGKEATPATTSTSPKTTSKSRATASPRDLTKESSSPVELQSNQASEAESAKETETAPPPPILPNVVAALSAPLKHAPQYGVPVASLQLRSYSVRSLEFFADFALRAAYYLNLAATGPVPLPKRIERWTTIRANFVHKKSQENFERITYKRAITIMDGDKSAVEVWLAVLRKWQFFGVGMKANVWEWESLDVGSKMDAQAKDLEREIEAKLANFGWNQSVVKSRSIEEMLQKQGAKHTGVPMMEVRDDAQRAKSEI